MSILEERLSQTHIDMLVTGSAISEDVIIERGYRTLETLRELHEAGFENIKNKLRVPGLLLPIWLTDGRNGVGVYRPDNPQANDDKTKPKNKDGTWPQKVRKYLLPAGSKMQLDAHPLSAEALKDPSRRLIITEGQKKGDALVSRGEIAISLLGVWNRRGKNRYGGLTVLPDWEEVALNGRKIFIIYDSDVWTNVNVRNAAYSMRRWLEFKDAEVRVIAIPQAEDGSKLGVDDYLAKGYTVEDVLNLYEVPPDLNKTHTDSKRLLHVLKGLGYTFRMNEANGDLEVNEAKITDGLRAKIRTQMRDAGYPQVNIIEDAYTAEAYDNRYHPIKDFLRSLEWNGEDHIAKLAEYFTDAHDPVEDRTLFHTWISYWLLGAVAKVMTDGEEQNQLLTLDGPQGIGKSFFARWIGTAGGTRPGLFVESSINPDSKDDLKLLASRLVWEVSELGHTARRADRESLKSFLSRGTVTWRTPYARYDQSLPATCSFLGTINNEIGFLTDPTGSRRFLSVTIKDINHAYSKAVDPRQVWAQAVAEYLQSVELGVRVWQLPDDYAELQRKINEEYQVDNAWAEYMQKYFILEPDSDEDLMLTTDIAAHLEAKGIKVSSPNSAFMHIGTAARLLGLTKKTKTPKGYYGVRIRPATDDQEVSAKDLEETMNNERGF